MERELGNLALKMTDHANTFVILLLFKLTNP
jgi:hypothetical protein